MDYVIRLLCWAPRFWHFAGYMLATTCGVLMALSWNLAEGAGKVERKTGVVVDLGRLLDAIPLPVPGTPEGFALASFGAVLGVGLALAGKWARKQA
ncbi:MAG: hypothetical protein QE485_10730 [Acidovorax sp.]|uniref:hypothetical protein n=1 Tax=Acidovorax sp. TaxID=1872122 RepID=UPI00261914DB|nr:hypothetical protein [Acidovorax sp.]MDH4417690.1 hypothetical protein [Acidovorax sp.]